MSKDYVKVKKKRFNFKRFLTFCLIIYCLFFAVFYLFKEPIRHIKILGNNFVSDNEIIEIAKIKNYPSFFRYPSFSIEKNIEKLELIKEARVRKKWGFVLEITVKENKPLFYDSNNNLIYLSNDKTVENKEGIVGIPTLVNYVDKEILDKFITNLKNVKENILYEANEIYYDPSYDEKGEILDSERFRVVMNDGNFVYLTALKADKLNYYNEIYASINDKKGSLFLDSGDYGNFGFTPFGSE